MPPSTRQQAYTSLWAMLNPGIAPGTEGAVKSAYARAQKVIDRLPYGDLRAFIADAQRIRRRTFGGPKVTQTMQSRVQQVIDYAGGALARVVSRPLGVSDSVQQSISDSASTLDDRLTLRGTDPASSEGIAAKTAFNNRSITRLWQRKAALQQSLARLKRIKPAGWRVQAKQITDEIGEIDRQVIGLAAENARAAKERASAAQSAPFENYGRAMSSIDLQERAGVLTAGQASALRERVRTGALAGELGALSQDERWQVMADLKDAVAANTAQQEEQTKLLAEQVANQQKLVALVTAQGPALIAAVSAVVSGDIGGRVGLGFQSPSFAGGLARY